MLEDEQTVIGADALDFRLQRCRDVAGERVRDNGDPLLRLQSKTHLDRVAGARDQFRVNWMEISAIGHN